MLHELPAALRTVQLHTSTSQSLINTDKLTAELEAQQHRQYPTALYMPCRYFWQNLPLHWSVAIATGREYDPCLPRGMESLWLQAPSA